MIMTSQTRVRCRALAGILPQEQLQAVLGNLCEELVDALDVSTPASVRCVPAAMQALSSIGRLAPEIFAKHAAPVADFVLEVSLLSKDCRNIRMAPLCAHPLTI